MSFRPQGNHEGLDTNSSIANHFQKANLAGTKWSHVSTGRTGINSILDKDIIKFKLVIKAAMPMLDNMTPQSTLNEE